MKVLCIKTVTETQNLDKVLYLKDNTYDVGTNEEGELYTNKNELGEYTHVIRDTETDEKELESFFTNTSNFLMTMISN